MISPKLHVNILPSKLPFLIVTLFPDLSHLDSLDGSEVEDDPELLSDEGLGDISSNEASSPQLNEEKKIGEGIDKCLHNVSESVNKSVNKCDSEDMDALAEKIARKASLHSPADERMPSRISLQVQTSL